ncbi:MAG: hypothetical protein OXE46_05640 [Chloroflexi bacterium]|nr:hypothetical protein [Chloroflexota bacterium]
MDKKLRDWLLPDWARRDSALLRYQLAKPGSGRSTLLQVTGWLLAIGIAALYIEAHSPADANIGRRIWRSSQLPTLALQMGTWVLAFVLGGATASGQRSRKTWDSLRATETGLTLALRMRWLGILLRLRAPITAILLLRLFYCLGMWVDLSAFGGHHSSMLALQALPPLPDTWQALPLIAATIAALLLQPFCAIGLGAALGILLSVLIRERLFAALAQIFIISAQLILVVAGSLQFNFVWLQIPGEAQFAWQLFYSALGDWGLSLGQLSNLGEFWSSVPGSAGIGLALLCLALAQGLAADGLLWLAARLAERRG